MATPQPPAKELAAIAARAAAAGKKPTQAAILATYYRNQARATATKPSARALSETAARRAGSTVTKPKASVATARRPDGRSSVPQAKMAHPPRLPRSGGPAVTPEWRAAAVRQGQRFKAEGAALDAKLGLGWNLEGMASMAKGTPVTAYYALGGALGAQARDAIMEKVYGREVLDALRRGKGDEAQALATGRTRPPSRRDE